MLDGQVIHVLPPLSRETGDKLKEMIKNHSPASIVAVAEQMPASINCTTLIITPVNDIEDDIFTQYLQNSLLEAYREENRDMYFPSGTAALDELGIVIDGNAVKFLNKTLTQQRTRQ